MVVDGVPMSSKKMKVWCAEAGLIYGCIQCSYEQQQMKVWCAEAGLMYGCRQCSYEQQANEGLVC